MKKSYLFLADGFEEIEALATVDIMRRGGMNVETVSIKDEFEVVGAHGVHVVADNILAAEDLDDAEWLIFPGGLPGAQYLHECKALNEALLEHAEKHGKIAAICASPAMVLGQAGLLDGKEATGYPGTEQLASKALWQDSMVVKADNIITGRGPAAAMFFGLAIVAESMGQHVADEIAKGMLL